MLAYIGWAKTCTVVQTTLRFSTVTQVLRFMLFIDQSRSVGGIGVLSTEGIHTQVVTAVQWLNEREKETTGNWQFK